MQSNIDFCYTQTNWDAGRRQVSDPHYSNGWGGFDNAANTIAISCRTDVSLQNINRKVYVRQ